MWFDFFLTRPYQRFTITDQADLETAVLLTLIGVAVPESLCGGRRQQRGRDIDVERPGMPADCEIEPIGLTGWRKTTISRVGLGVSASKRCQGFDRESMLG